MENDLTMIHSSVPNYDTKTTSSTSSLMLSEAPPVSSPPGIVPTNPSLHLAGSPQTSASMECHIMSHVSRVLLLLLAYTNSWWLRCVTFLAQSLHQWPRLGMLQTSPCISRRPRSCIPTSDVQQGSSIAMATLCGRKNQAR